MSLKNSTVGILLSLVLGLSTAVSVAHSHYYHNQLSFHDDHAHHDNNVSSSHHNHQNSDDGHDESGCVFTVVQYTESLIAHLTPYFSLKTLFSYLLKISFISHTLIYTFALITQLHISISFNHEMFTLYDNSTF